MHAKATLKKEAHYVRIQIPQEEPVGWPVLLGPQYGHHLNSQLHHVEVPALLYDHLSSACQSSAAAPYGAGYA